MILIPCPPAGARVQLDVIDESSANPADLANAVRAALELLEARPQLLRYVLELDCWPSKN